MSEHDNTDPGRLSAASIANCPDAALGELALAVAPPETAALAAALLARWTLLREKPRLDGRFGVNTRTSGLFLEWCVRDVGPAALSALWTVDIVLAARFIADFEAEVARALREYARGRGGGFIFAQLCAIMRRQWRNLETAVLGTAVLAEDDGGLTAEGRKARDA